MANLCSEIILGQDFMAKHSGIFIKFGVNLPSLNICGLAKVSITAPTLFANLLPECKPIAITFRRFSTIDKKFIADEIAKLLKKGIIEKSNSPWRAQVVISTPENHKKRLVIDYSRTINRYTLLDAYPLPKIQELVETVAKYKVFSTLDLKSAYHQILIMDISILTSLTPPSRLMETCISSV